MSKSSTKVFIAVLISGLLTAYYFLVFVPHRDKQAANDFITAYEKYEKANSAFIVPLIASDLRGEELGIKTIADDVDDKIDQLDWNIPVGDPYRIQLAEGAIADNKEIIKLIRQTDKPQTDCEAAQLALNTAAASLNDTEMRKCATEICDYVLERHNNLVSYKQALLERRKLISEMMKSYIEDNGKLSSFLIQNTDKIEKLSEIIVKSPINYREQRSKIETTYARFKGLAGIQDNKQQEKSNAGPSASVGTTE